MRRSEYSALVWLLARYHYFDPDYVLDSTLAAFILELFKVLHFTSDEVYALAKKMGVYYDGE